MTSRVALEPWDGYTPEVVGKEGRYVLGRIAPDEGGLSHGVWDRSSRKRLFGVPGAAIAAFAPGTGELAVVRVEIPKGSTSRADHRWIWERYALPGGARVGHHAIAPTYSAGWLVSITFQHQGKVAKIVCGDDDRAYSFHVALAKDGRDSERT